MNNKVRYAFKLWYIEKYHLEIQNNIFTLNYSDFLSQPITFKWGVLQDFYDNHDIFTEVCYDGTNEDLIRQYYFAINDSIIVSSNYPSRAEAREAALKKAEEILINKLKKR